MTVLAGVIALALAGVHLLGGRLRSLDAVPRSRWLSAAGGVSVAYVFVHILPDLAAGQRTIRAAAGGALGYAEHHVYLLAMTGLIAFYGLERLAKRSRGGGDDGHGGTTPGAVFWVHVGAYAAYNLLIGYLLLHRERPGVTSLLFFAAAMATHFLVNDVGLRAHHGRRYRRFGRWLLAGAVLLGWGVAVVVEVHEAAVAGLFAVLAGGTILNVLKEELPEERQSTFWAFLLGAVAYAALLLAV